MNLVRDQRGFKR